MSLTDPLMSVLAGYDRPCWTVKLFIRSIASAPDGLGARTGQVRDEDPHIKTLLFFNVWSTNYHTNFVVFDEPYPL